MAEGYLCLDEGEEGSRLARAAVILRNVAFCHLTLWSLGKTTTGFCMSFRDFFIEADLKENEPLVRAPPQRSVVHEVSFGAADQGRHWEQRDCIFFAEQKKVKKKMAPQAKKNLGHGVTPQSHSTNPFFAEQKMKNGAAGKKILRYSLDGAGFHGAVSNPFPQGTPVQPHGGDLVGGVFWIRHPSPPFFPLPRKLVILHERSHPDTRYFFSGSSEPL